MTNNHTNPNLKIDNEPLPIGTQTKFLGITTDNQLDSKDHVNNIIRKISINKTLIGKSRNLMDTSAKRNIYYTHIYPHLSYANMIWSSHTRAQTKENNLEKYKGIIY